MAHETIKISNQGVHVLEGSIARLYIDLKGEPDTADISVVGEMPNAGCANIRFNQGLIENVQFFYHCENSETANTTGLGFSAYDHVIVLNYGSAEILDVNSMKIVGFVDGLPRTCSCDLKAKLGIAPSSSQLSRKIGGYYRLGSYWYITIDTTEETVYKQYSFPKKLPFLYIYLPPDLGYYSSVHQATYIPCPDELMCHHFILLIPSGRCTFKSTIELRCQIGYHGDDYIVVDALTIGVLNPHYENTHVPQGGTYLTCLDTPRYQGEASRVWYDVYDCRGNYRFSAYSYRGDNTDWASTCSWIYNG